MTWYWVLMGALAAFGAVCMVLTGIGLVLPGGSRRTICLILPAEGDQSTERRFSWLQKMGLLRCRIFVMYADPPEPHLEIHRPSREEPER